MKRFLMASAAAVLISLSAGCGLKGKLERPAPMWGPARKSYIEEQKAAEAAKKAEREAQRPHVDIPVETPSGTGIATIKPAPSDTQDDEDKRSESLGAVQPLGDMSSASPKY